MIQIKKIKCSGNSIIWIWKVEESVEKLKILSSEHSKIINEKKRKEFYASRILIEKMCKKLKIKFNGIFKDSNGKPFLKGSSYSISISHKFPYVVAMIDEKNCGIDIEKIDGKIEKIKSKFLSDEELKITKNDIIELTKYWSIKESTYKLKGSTVPLKKIKIKKISENYFESFIEGEQFEISTMEIDRHILSFTN